MFRLYRSESQQKRVEIWDFLFFAVAMMVVMAGPDAPVWLWGGCEKPVLFKLTGMPS